MQVKVPLTANLQKLLQIPSSAHEQHVVARVSIGHVVGRVIFMLLQVPSSLGRSFDGCISDSWTGGGAIPLTLKGGD